MDNDQDIWDARAAICLMLDNKRTRRVAGSDFIYSHHWAFSGSILMILCGMEFDEERWDKLHAAIRRLRDA